MWVTETVVIAVTAVLSSLSALLSLFLSIRSRASDRVDRAVAENISSWLKVKEGVMLSGGGTTTETVGVALLESANHHQRKLSLVAVDLNGFKTINDRFGHEFGDRALVHVATLLQGLIRQQDLMLRRGGDEFLLIMPNTEASDAEEMAKKVTSAISEQPVQSPVGPVRLSASAGVATSGSTAGETWKDLVDLAEKSLYLSKSTHIKNRSSSGSH